MRIFAFGSCFIIQNQKLNMLFVFIFGGCAIKDVLKMSQKATATLKSGFHHDCFDCHLRIRIEQTSGFQHSCPINIVNNGHIHGLFEVIGQIFLIAAQFSADGLGGKILFEIIFNHSHRVCH